MNRLQPLYVVLQLSDFFRTRRCVGLGRVQTRLERLSVLQLRIGRLSTVSCYRRQQLLGGCAQPFLLLFGTGVIGWRLHISLSHRKRGIRRCANQYVAAVILFAHYTLIVVFAYHRHW